MIKFRVVYLFISLSLLACSETSDKKLSDKTHYFGHRGYGSGVISDSLVENTIPSIKSALELYDGVEVDIQMSLDGSLWVYHDDSINSTCDSLGNFLCVPKMNDNEISELRICKANIETRVFKLVEVFELLSHDEYKTKMISLDVKSYFSSNCFEGKNPTREYFNEMSLNIVQLEKKFGLEGRVLVETDSKYFLDQVKENSETIRTHLLAYHEFGKVIQIAEEREYNGVSFNLNGSGLTKENMEMALNKDLEVQLWTVYNSNQLKEAYLLSPFSIQITRPKAYSIFMSNLEE